MNINRPAGTGPISAAATATGKDRVGPTAVPAAAKADLKPECMSLPLRLNELPDIDLAKVAALKSALIRGELTSDIGALAAAMLAWHRGGAA